VASRCQDKTKWVFKLRPGVKFHDGSAFNADAVVWNVNKVLDKNAVQFDPSQVGTTASRMPTLRSARKIDDLTVDDRAEPDSFLPSTSPTCSWPRPPSGKRSWPPCRPR
jgi:ABC-type transport system substrate-binding protein